MSGWYRRDGADVLVSLHVQPRARRAGIVGRYGDTLKIRVQAPPEGGRANREVIELLAEAFAVPRSAVTLAAGRTGRRKLARVSAPGRLPQVRDA